MVEEDLGNRFSLISLTNPMLPPGAKRLRDAKHEFVSQLRRRVRESTPAGHTSFPRAREGAQDPIVSIEVRGPQA